MNALAVDMALGCSTNTVLHLQGHCRRGQCCAGNPPGHGSTQVSEKNAAPLLPEPRRCADHIEDLERAPAGSSAVLNANWPTAGCSITSLIV
jgi:hypothetical protein